MQIFSIHLLFSSHSSDDSHLARKNITIDKKVRQIVFCFCFSIENKTIFFDRIQDPTVIDPVYETLKIAAETRKRTIATYLQQRQQTLNKQMSLNSQGSSEVEIQPSPRIPRHPTPVDPSPRIRRQNARTETELARAASGKRKSLPCQINKKQHEIHLFFFRMLCYVSLPDLASLPNPNANI